MGVGTQSLPCAHIILIVEAKAEAKMASMSGVELTDRSKHLYEEIYKGKKHRYVVFAIKDGKIDAETIGDLEKTYDEFLVDVKKETDAGKKDCSLRLRVHLPARRHNRAPVEEQNIPPLLVS